MPPWVASVPRLTIRSKTGLFDRVPLALLRCRCQSSVVVAVTPPSSSARRSASTHVSPTAINLRPNIPPRNKELYDALSMLGGAAETWVSRSRLQLALRGLEAQDAVTRVAVLGLDGQMRAQQLARLLLADPLSVEESWEKELVKIGGQGDEGGPVLLKYGTDPDEYTPTPLHKTMVVPSRTLQSHNIEMLVSTVNVNGAKPAPHVAIDSATESLLVPKLQAPAARALPVPFPVHRTLVVGGGLDSAVAFGRFSADGSLDEVDDNMVRLAIDLPVPSDETTHSEPHSKSAAPINIQVGTKALASFRESIQNSIVYERGWFKSGLPRLSKWLVQHVQTTDDTIKPTLKTLIVSVVDDAEANILKEDTAFLQERAAISTHQDVTADLIRHLETWAEKSHAELRDQLDEAFASDNWHKLAWWKLLWRVDDVTMLGTELLERRWLVAAEKNSIYLAGRMTQAGFPDELPHTSDIVVTNTPDNPPQPQPPISTTTTTTHKPTTPNWSDTIALSRTDLITTTIPPLQALAQRLLLQTFTTTSLSSAASALLYLSVSSFSVAEAAAVAALGLTFSLKRMQSVWEGARENWQGLLREEGRRTLKASEEGVRGVLDGMKGKGGGEDVGVEVERRREARRMVEGVRGVLERMSGDA